MRKINWAIMIFFFILVSCDTSEKLDSGISENSHSVMQENVPDGYARFSTAETSLITGTYSWIDIEADSGSPKELTDQVEPLEVKPNGEVQIYFKGNKRKPIDVKLFRWEELDKGNQIELQENHTFIAPSEQGEYVFGLVTKWVEGNVYYALKVKVN
ncbi:hypothetical protein FIU87_01125 [Bacillus sp. THAF10]|uniref:hypothetical protein n=1 Tax=Bacillus sp. THAF10 TaxID=2587848 RepID=UPI001267F1B7|nr:hypothetical protein [Bacillus sp. THAF10]QFT87253.1 hypothetical protein FIU87_01125 [Bacillus sp. THAF10]